MENIIEFVTNNMILLFVAAGIILFFLGFYFDVLKKK